MIRKRLKFYDVIWVESNEYKATNKTNKKCVFTDRSTYCPSSKYAWFICFHSFFWFYLCSTVDKNKFGIGTVYDMVQLFVSYNKLRDMPSTHPFSRNHFWKITHKLSRNALNRRFSYFNWNVSACLWMNNKANTFEFEGKQSSF